MTMYLAGSVECSREDMVVKCVRGYQRLGAGSASRLAATHVASGEVVARIMVNTVRADNQRVHNAHPCSMSEAFTSHPNVSLAGWPSNLRSTLS